MSSSTPIGGHVKGKVVAVVGASSGMGRATAATLARHGAHVFACARRMDALQSLETEFANGASDGDGGGSLTALAMDVRQRSSVEAGLKTIYERFRRIDVLIYAAGINIPARAIDVLSTEDWDDLIATHLTGAFFCTQEVLPLLQRQDDGLIVYISSVSARRGDVSGVAYQAAKRGVDGIVAGARTELKGGNVRFSLIYPGLCDTPLIDRRPKPPSAEERAKALKPQDIADLCLYLVGTPSHVVIEEVVVVPK